MNQRSMEGFRFCLSWNANLAIFFGRDILHKVPLVLAVSFRDGLYECSVVLQFPFLLTNFSFHMHAIFPFHGTSQFIHRMRMKGFRFCLSWNAILVIVFRQDILHKLSFVIRCFCSEWTVWMKSSSSFSFRLNEYLFSYAFHISVPSYVTILSFIECVWIK